MSYAWPSLASLQSSFEGFYLGWVLGFLDVPKNQFRRAKEASINTLDSLKIKHYLVTSGIDLSTPFASRRRRAREFRLGVKRKLT